MDLSDLKAKAEAATPEACELITYRPGSGHSWYPIHRPDCAWNTKNRPCDCDVHLRKGAVEAFSGAVTPQTVLALVKVVEALQEFRDADRDPTRIDELVGRLADAFDALDELEAME